MAYGLEQLRRPTVFGGDDWGTSWDPSGGSMGYSQPYEDPFGPSPYPVQQPQQPTFQGGGIQPQESPVQIPRAPQIPSVQRNQIDNTPQTLEQFVNAVNGIYTPSVVDRDRFRGLLDRYPQQYNPTTGDRWAAALVGLGERNKPNGDVLGTQERILQGPRIRDIEDWKNQAVPFGQAAQFENSANNIERQLAQTAVTGWNTAEKTRLANEIAQGKLEQERIRTAAYDFKNRNPTWVYKEIGDTAYMVDPSGSGRKVPLGPSGKLSDQAKIDLEGSWDVKAAAARGDAAVRTAQAQPGQLHEIEMPDGTKRYMVLNRAGELVEARVRPADSGAPTGAPKPLPSGAKVTKTGSGAGAKVNQRELDMETDARVRDAISADSSLDKHFAQDPVTKRYMLEPPPQPPTGLLSGFTQAWPTYYKEMEEYNRARKVLLGPDTPDIKAKYRGGESTETKGVGPSVSRQIDMPNPSGRDVYIPSGNARSTPKPATTSKPSSSTTTSTIPPTTSSIYDQPRSSTSSSSTTTTTTKPQYDPFAGAPTRRGQEGVGEYVMREEEDNGPDPIPQQAWAAVPKGAKVDANANTFRYVTPNGQVKYWNRERQQWTDYDPTSGPPQRRRR